MRKDKIGGFTLIEMSIVILIFCALVGIIYGAKTLVKMSRLANAINLTAQVDFDDDDSLVLWLETSNMTRENKTGSISNWRDLSKNRNEFTTNTGSLEFTNSKIYNGLNAIKFDGTNYLKSSTPLNLSQYTAFLVANPDSGLSSSTEIINSGLVITVGELSSNKIIVVENTGSNKYSKSVGDVNFTLLGTSLELSTSPSEFYIGSNGFKGEILGMIIFNRILEDSEIQKIEEYLINKYMR